MLPNENYKSPAQGLSLGFHFLNPCMLVFMLLLCLSKLLFFKKKKPFRYTIKVTNCLDQDREVLLVMYGSNNLQMLSTDDKSRRKQGKS